MTARRTRSGSPLLAVGYLRVSTEDQKLGPEAQRAAIEAWAARAGVQVASWHVDQGVSGGADIESRPGLAAALVELRGLRAGVLVVAKRDRLARDVYIASTIERAAAQAGARVVCADGAGNGDTPTDAFMRTIVDGAAAYERALIRSRTKAALAAKRARGERAGAVPYGFTADASGKLEVNAAEQAVIAQVRELRAAGLPLGAVVEAHPELTTPAARARLADWIETEENPMVRKKDDEDRLDTTIGVRMAPGDIARLDALTERVRVASRTTIARAALLLGLAALEEDPTRLFAAEPPKPKRKR